MGLGRLYGKEMRAHLLELVIITILVAAAEITANIYFTVRLGLVVPMLGIPIWLITSPFASLNEEWADRTAYWLLSLPVREELTLAAKLLAIITRLFLISLPAMIGIYFLVARAAATAVPLSWTTAYVAVYLAYLAISLPVATASFLAVMVERAVRWGGGLTQMAVFGFTLWAMARLGGWLLNVLDFLPGRLRVPEPMALGSGDELFMFSLGWPGTELPLLALVVVGLVLASLALELAAWLLRRWVEV